MLISWSKFENARFVRRRLSNRRVITDISADYFHVFTGRGLNPSFFTLTSNFSENVGRFWSVSSIRVQVWVWLWCLSIPSQHFKGWSFGLNVNGVRAIGTSRDERFFELSLKFEAFYPSQQNFPDVNVTSRRFFWTFLRCCCFVLQTLPLLFIVWTVDFRLKLSLNQTS